jgi:hypothetical protein
MTRELSQRFSLNRSRHKFAEKSREEEEIAFTDSIAAPSLFRTGSMADRAIAAKKKQTQKTNVKDGRKATILESLGNFEESQELSLFTEEPQRKLQRQDSLEPVNIKKGRKPYRWKKTQCQQVYGDVVPSDQAYVDMTLDKGDSLPPGSSWTDFLALDSLAYKISNEDMSFCYVSTHAVKYNGETIWRVETRSNFNGKGTWGQSSSCVMNISKGTLRFKLIHKGRKNLGQGWNSSETREYSLANMIKKSGEAREREMFA